MFSPNERYSVAGGLGTAEGAAGLLLPPSSSAGCVVFSLLQSRPLFPISRLPLIKPRRPKQGALAEVRAHDLERQREAFAVESGRDGDGGGADEVCGGGEDVVQIHREGVFGLRADGEGGFGGGRGDEVVECPEGFGEFLAEFGADALGSSVVGVVIAGREGEGAEHDAAFHFVAEAFTAGVEVDLL